MSETVRRLSIRRERLSDQPITPAWVSELIRKEVEQRVTEEVDKHTHHLHHMETQLDQIMSTLHIIKAWAGNIKANPSLTTRQKLDALCLTLERLLPESTAFTVNQVDALLDHLASNLAFLPLPYNSTQERDHNIRTALHTGFSEYLASRPEHQNAITDVMRDSDLEDMQL